MELNEQEIKNTGNEEEDRNTLRDFFDNTSLHGARFLNDKNIYIRLAWFIILATAFGYCSFQIYNTLNLFYERPFSTAISKERKAELEFPAVTICNLNVISKRQYAERFKNIRNKTDQELELEIQEILDEIQGTDGPEIMKEMGSEWYRDRGSYMEAVWSVFSHKIEDMLGLEWLTPCSWKGKKCSAENFTEILSLEKGKCYTFNSGKEGRPSLKTSLPGSNNGLKLRLNVEAKDHVSHSLSIESGFKIAIQHQSDMPQVEEFGFAVQPGTYTYVSLHPRKIKNLEYPYETNCNSPELNITKASHWSYSVFSCIKECTIKYVVESCGCQPLHKILPGEEICSINETFRCVFPILLGSKPGNVSECSSQCPEPCEYYKYDYQLSTSAISTAIARNVPQDIAAKAPEKVAKFNNKSLSEKQAFLRENVVAVDIYFEEIAYDVIEQKRVLSKTAVFGAIGGHLGLFLGMSVLTILEFIDFLINFIFKKSVTNNQQTRVHHQS